MSKLEVEREQCRKDVELLTKQLEELDKQIKKEKEKSNTIKIGDSGIYIKITKPMGHSFFNLDAVYGSKSLKNMLLNEREVKELRDKLIVLLGGASV